MDASPHCLTCGAPLPLPHRFVRMVTCEFCGQVMLLDDGRLSLTETVAEQTPFPSVLVLGATGTVAGRSFEALGRLVYAYDGGVWHEWLLQLADAAPGTNDLGWLVEDEGTFTLLQKAPLPGTPPRFEDVRAGMTLRLANRSVFVTEVGTATISHSEGQAAFAVPPGTLIQYIDGTSDGQQVGLEYDPTEVEWFVGDRVDPPALDDAWVSEGWA